MIHLARDARFTKMMINLNKLKKLSEDIVKWDSKKAAQPFKTNALLEEVLKSQTPKWVDYIILAASVLAAISGIWALLHNYNLI